MKVIRLYPPRLPKWVKWILITLVCLLALPFLLLIALQTDPVQQLIRGKAERYLAEKLQTPVRIGGIRITWFSHLELDGVYIADKQRKALLFSRSLKVHYDLIELLRNKLLVHRVDWEDVLLNAYSLPSGEMNYQFVADAFATKDSVTLTKDTTESLAIDIRNIDLRKFRVIYRDNKSGMNATVRWDLLHLRFQTIELETNTLDLRELKSDGLAAVILQDYRVPDKEASKSDTGAVSLVIRSKLINLQNTTLLYGDNGSGIRTGWKAKSLSLKLAGIDLAKTSVNGGFIDLEAPQGFVVMNKGLDTAKVVDTSANTWVIQSPALHINSGSFKMDNLESPVGRFPGAFDASHFHLSPLQVSVRDFRFTPAGITAILEQLQVTDKSGFTVRNAHADIVYSDSVIRLDNLLLETNKSRIADQIGISGPGWDKLSSNLDALGIIADLKNTHLVLAEALYFIPEFRNRPEFKKLWNKEVDLSGRIGGTLNSLAISQLHFRDNAGNDITLTGNIAQVTDPKRIQVALSHFNIRSGDQAVRSWLPENTIPGNIAIPASLQASGSLNGNMQSAATDFQLISTFGNLSLKGKVANFTDSIRATYDVTLRQLDMDLGKWIRDTSIGRVVATGNVKGRGYALQAIDAAGAIRIRSADFQGYQYQHLSMTGKLAKGSYEATVKSDDPNLQASIDLTGNITDKYPTVSGAIKVDRVDLMAIGMSTSPFVVKGNFMVNVKNTKPRALEGQVFATAIQMADASNIYSLDSIKILAKADSGIQHIRLESPFGYADATGDYDYTTILSAAQAIVQQHLSKNGKDSISKYTQTHQDLNLNASLYWPKSLKALSPGLVMNQPLDVQAHVNTDSVLVTANAYVVGFSYDSIRIDTTRLSLIANRDSLGINAMISSLRHPSFPLYRTQLLARAAEGSVNWGVRMDDNKDQEKYYVAGILDILKDSGYDLRLARNLLLNKTPFSTGDKNFIAIRNNGITQADLQLLSAGQELTISSGAISGKQLPPLNIKLRDFRLSTITGVLGQDTTLAEALINGQADLAGLDSAMTIKADLQVTDIVVQNIAVGDLSVKMNSPEAGTYQVEAALTGNANDVRVTGQYAKELQFDVAMKRLNLSSLEPFAMGKATRMKGYTAGNLTITGPADKPKVAGELAFHDAQANITLVNATLRFPDDKLQFDESGIIFNNFIVKDSLDGTTTINGRIRTTDYTDYAFDLKVNTDNFMAVGPKVNNDQEFYGPAFIDSRISVTGDLDLPVIDMDVTLRDKSQLTVTIPDDEPGIEDRDGVIVFVNRSNPVDSSLLEKNADSLAIRKAKIRGMDFSAGIHVTKTSTITIIIDPVNGDFLEAKGSANLNLTIDPSSKMSLTGRYEIEEGKYEMSLNQLIKRSFAVEKGSNITWDGDATGAELDITARYDVRAPAIDLIGDQITSATTNKRQYNQRIPVEVYLMIKDKLLKPSISFRLDMPEKDRSIFNGAPYTRIKQINNIESQLNKQVMGLLVLQTFISEDPLASMNSGAGNTVSDAARQSVSKILSQQLNNLAANLIKGVDLNFDLQSEEDYSTGSKSERTTLNVGASKSMFNDRLTVAVGSNIGIAGNTPGNASALIGDITVDYALSRDGRYKLRAFQRNQTDAILQGQIIETGVTFMLVMDFNTFKEIFRKSKEEIELKKREQEAKRKK
ncbi:translocation/assembly module TamB domain-containing protein [Flavihumibacter petaseus]|uniref:Translocation and assembly module TamB C-terminal domain-containing protein n=1 Tax=Flavihumibacter petaseus NBRC 106054 TaxID=1220578 RepID=A0A0E9N7J5_9BACT|nr:translocation/assembly module TamB [Flavihumibacter petaseus]GAO45686.1 hypothetical protein FPE01S_08_00060 [Flavihumibacter petaseus NBRC 106054]